MRDWLDPIAQALGVTTDELQNDLRNGQSIADIAKSKNVDLGTVADAVVKEVQSKLDQAVSDKKLTQDQADHIVANLKEHVTDLLNGKPPMGDGPGFRMHGDGPGRFGPGGGGPWPGPPEAATPSAAI